MKNLTISIYILYVWLKIILGLIFKPFITVREMIRKPVLVPVIFSPFLGLLVLFILGRIAAFFYPLSGVKREIIAVILGTALISITLWQVLLIYLLISLLVVFFKKS